MTDISRFVTRAGRRIEVEVLDTGAPVKKRRTDRLIGCPVNWLKRVLPLVKTKEQLAVALWLHRRRAICGNELFTLPNDALQEELGLSRKTKFHALHRLERMGVIALVRDNKHAIRARLLW